MLNKKDFIEFCDELMSIEIEMKKRILKLVKYIKDEKAELLLRRIAKDEDRHAIIVEEIRKIINKEYL